MAGRDRIEGKCAQTFERGAVPMEAMLGMVLPDRIELSKEAPLLLKSLSFFCVSAPEAVVPRFAMKVPYRRVASNNEPLAGPLAELDQQGTGVEAVPPDHLPPQGFALPLLGRRVKVLSKYYVHQSRSKPAR